MSGPLTEQEQHQALSYLHACVNYREDDPSSEPPHWLAIADLLSKFSPTQLWDRVDDDG